MWDIPDEGFDLKEVLRSHGKEKELDAGWEPSSIKRLWNRAMGHLEIGEYVVVQNAFDAMYTTSREKLYKLLYESNFYDYDAEEYED